VRDEDMNGLKILEALRAIMQHNFDEGVTKIENVDLEVGELWLFGLDENSDSSFALKYKKCKWYQVGCHLSNVWEWLSSPAIGGGATNGQTLLWAIGILSGAIGIVAIFI